MAINTFDVAEDFTGTNTLVAAAPEYTNAVALVADVAESITIPAGADIVIFSSNIDFYGRANATATVPTDTTDGTASQMNPTAWKLTKRSDGETPITSISVISSGAGIVTASFYKLKA